MTYSTDHQTSITPIYLDNAATTFPKPDSVIRSIRDYLENYGVSPGRSGHSLAIKAAREVFETRELIASFFKAELSDKVVFTANATQALNIAIKGILKRGDHVIISHLEHNSVYRPVRHLEKNGIIELSVCTCDSFGVLDQNHLESLFRPNTRMVIINHGSNVFGTIQPIQEICVTCKSKGVLLLLDATQTAGLIPIDMTGEQMDILAFSGHKKLYGPPGIGGLVINADLKIDSFIQGGTGSRSESGIHPDFYPDRLEAGTPNTLGIVGLKAGLLWLLQQDIQNIRNRLFDLCSTFLQGLNKIDRVTIHGPLTMESRLPVVSITLQGINPGSLAHRLDSEYGIMTRAGLHCAPLAHQGMGTLPQGTLRFSPGAFNTAQEIQKVIQALQEIASQLS